ncbi:MAG: chorismate synthase [Chloroflexi bacterium 44-23]|nr:MAG: chorismate synthase [Chloroflexi bacterium 44-23]
MAIQYFTAGESHGPVVLTILNGIPAGLDISPAEIDVDLARRQLTLGAGGRMRLEHDKVQILAGVMAGKTTGAPMALQVENRDHVRWKNKSIAAFTTPRPGHADLNGVLKFGYDDIRPALERASARETAVRVAAGAVARKFLSVFGIKVGGYVTAIGEVEADVSTLDEESRIHQASLNPVVCPDEVAAAKMILAIERVMQQRDTLGGIIEVVALGLPPGLGSFMQADQRLDARLGAAVLGVQAMKGVEIGPAFDNTRRQGTQVQDAIQIENGRLVRLTNRCGGLEGGITTGQPLIVRAAMKPIATTLTPQKTVDLASGEMKDTVYERSDFCPVPRAVVILEAVIALELANALILKVGGDSVHEMLLRFNSLSQARLEDIHLKGGNQVWWVD